MADGEIADHADRARRHYQVTFALLALAGVAYALLQSLVAPGGYTIAFAACALALALGFVAGLAIPPRRPADAFAAHEAGDLAEVAPRESTDPEPTLSR
jgi:hypothetical protein